MQNQVFKKRATKDAKLSKVQFFFAKMATKYAKLSKKAVCGKNGQKNMQ